MDKRLLMIVNPISGTQDKSRLQSYVKARLGASGISVDTRLTSGPGDASMFAAEAIGGGYDGVIVAGGDGTINDTAGILLGSEIPLGIIPLGSGNGLARHIGISQVDSALDVIADGNVATVDYGTANHRPFFCTFGMGFDAAVSRRFANESRRGKMSYIKSILLEYIKFAPEEYVISLPDGRVLTEKAFLVAVCNASQYGNNAYIAPNASITDGLFDVTIIHSGSHLTRAMAGVEILTGLVDSNMLIDYFQTASLSIRRKGEGLVHLDGDPVVLSNEVNLNCHHGDLKMFLPATEKSFTPIVTPMQEFFTDLTSDIRQLIKI